MACNMGEVATVDAWLDSGHHPDEATADGDTLLFAAAERGGPDKDAVGPQTPAGIVRSRPLVLAVGARLCRGSGRRSIEGAILADPVLMVEWLWV